tara:strand:+ start:63 stop:815 length:753 start_codon:yes stop_codon:yes gene_type:complete
MTLGILLSTFNGEKFIDLQIKSIINQTFQDWTLLICDDCSQDNTVKLLDYYSKIDSRISYQTNNKRLGPTFSFLNLLKTSNFKYVIFCDQDDKWSVNKLEEIYKFIDLHKEDFLMGLHNGEFLIENNNSHLFNNKPILDKDRIYSGKPDLRFISLLKSNKVVGCLSFVDREKIKKLIKINPPKNKGIFLDYWLALIASTQNSGIKFLDKNLISYRRHEGVATLNKRSIISKLITKFIIIYSLIINSFLQN